ncbi:hypothetical protein [Streptomyces sp. NPDC020330]|uniref:hypothetical protein n=1 Tax=unclassified Streptomyces TaxID=2593676 RepID=UPI003797C7DC
MTELIGRGEGVEETLLLVVGELWADTHFGADRGGRAEGAYLLSAPDLAERSE